MFKVLKALYNEVSINGLKLPFAYDATSGKPSVTLMFAYTSFIAVMLSLLFLHLYKQLLQATITTIIVWVLAMVMYRLRELDRVKINLKDQSIDLEDDPSNNEKDKK